MIIIEIAALFALGVGIGTVLFLVAAVLFYRVGEWVQGQWAGFRFQVRLWRRR